MNLIVEPGLTLVHHVAKGDFFGGLVGNLEQWGQWGSGGDLSACHVEGIYDTTQIARMNPKFSVLYLLSTAPWPIITGLRLDLSRYNVPGVPQYPGQDPAFVRVLQAEIKAHLNELYAWPQIFRFTCIGLLARVWPSAAQKMLASANDAHAKVCSQWWTARLENSVRGAYGHLSDSMAKYDLFTGTDVGDGEERPADYIKSFDLHPVT